MRFFVKYAFDRIFSFIGIIITLPLFLILPVIIRIDSKGPVLFRQKRVGKNGRMFTILKFRSMELNDGVNTITSRTDSRITRAGSFLRKWKLDELPELFNVLMGDMSFVGPRPDVPGYADRLEGENRKVLLLRPGVTGPATLKYLDEEEILSGVSDPQHYNDEFIFPDKVRINLNYLEKFSFAGDLKIIYYTLIRRKINEY
jgi:lipopolysaccharide/colanic/teichoic acid biosynthesis glycosyltransferase